MLADDLFRRIALDALAAGIPACDDRRWDRACTAHSPSRPRREGENCARSRRDRAAVSCLFRTFRASPNGRKRRYHGLVPYDSTRHWQTKSGARDVAVRGMAHFGGRRPGLVSHSLRFAAVSASRALRNSSCRSWPGGSREACNRASAAASSRRSEVLLVFLRRLRFLGHDFHRSAPLQEPSYARRVIPSLIN